ncbi:NUDIX hydrolase [Monashia sp. NPDC004114]
MTSTLSGITYAGRSGTIEPSPTLGGGKAGAVGDAAPRPEWIDDLAVKLEDAAPEWFSHFVPPEEGGRESAVLILFGPPPAGASSADEHLVLIERSHTMRTQPAQIAFPGGSRDPGDADLVETALREAAEETGLDPSGVEVVTQLPTLYLAPAQFVVAPVLGWWAHPSPLSVRDPAEVHDVLAVPVSHLVDPATRFSVTHPSGFVGPGFDLDELLLWGFTAGLVSAVLEIAGLSRPWDAGVHRPLPERYFGGPRR